MLSVAAFALFSLVCVVFAFTRHPIWGLYFYLCSIYIHPPSRWWSYIVPDLRWALLSAGVTTLAVLYHRGRLAPKPIWLGNAPAALLALYALLMWLQTPFVLDIETHVIGTIQFTKYLIGFWFVYRIADKLEHVRDILFAHALGCAMLGVYAMTAGRQDGRLDGVGGPGIDDANTLGMYLATGALTAFGLFLTQHGWRRWFALLLGAFATEGFVLANSRGAFLGLAAGGLVLAFAQARQHRRVFWGCALVALLGLGMVVDQLFIERMFTIGDVAEQSEDADMSARSRVVIFDAQKRMVLDYPLGTGWRGTATLSPRYIDERWLTADPSGGHAERSSHNTFMTTLVEQGFLGALLYLAIIGWLLRTIWRLRGLSRIGLEPELVTLAATMCAGLTVVFVAGQAADYLLAEVQFWLFAALVSAMQMAAPGGARKPDSAAATTVQASARLRA